MQKTLNVAKDLPLPRNVVTSTIVVYGGKGMGKTNLGSVLVEELNKMHDHWCVLDPMGVWWGLRHSKDGKGPGIECIILGGAHGDIPIEPTGGAIVADLVVDENANTIIDFSRKANGQMWTVGEKIRFVTEYTQRLFQRQGELINGQRREPMMQLLDEAARYIPQTIPSGAIDVAKCVGAWEQVCEEGRNIGLGVAFLTQRSARMNKSVSELADVMFAFRTIGPNSLRAVMDWLGEHVEKDHVRELASQVRELDIGQALVVSPGWLKVEKIASIRPRETFDSSATPKPGEKAKRVTGKASKPDLGKYHERMAETIEKLKMDDPKELRKRILELEKAAKNVSTTSKPQKEMVTSGTLKNEYNRGYFDGTQKGRQDGAMIAQKGFDEIKKKVTAALLRTHGDIDKALEFLKVERVAVARVTPPEVRQAATPPAQYKEVGTMYIGKAPKVESHLVHHQVFDPPLHMTSVSNPQQRILNALAWLESASVMQSTRSQLAAMSEQSPKSSGYLKNLGTLSAAGLIAYPSPGFVALTDAGRDIAEAPTEALTGNTIQERAKFLISTPQRAMLEALITAYPDSITRENLAPDSGQSATSSGYLKNLGTLRTFGFIEYPQPGLVKAADLLFI